MGRIHYEDRLGEYGTPTDFINEFDLSFTAASSTLVTMKDAEGDGFSVFGTGLTYDGGGNLVGGTLTGFRIFNSASQTLISGDRFQTAAPAVIGAFNLQGIEAALMVLLGRGDRIIGSGVGDALMAGNGADTILGGNGDDFLYGMKGDDLLTGGKGGDVFMVAGGGADHVLDFQDTGGSNDDRVGLARRLYRDMAVSETATGVVLDFGAKGVMTIDGWHAADVGQDDFLFV